MNELQNIERANENNFLWPPIADAVDTFLRRRETADAYERIWRLIHIWESIATVLSGAIAARLRHCSSEVPTIHLKVREHLYGATYDKIDHRMKAGQGAFDGSNDKRIEILRMIEKADDLPCNFLRQVKAFLEWSDTRKSEAEEARPSNARFLSNAIESLLNVWKRVCDVPTNASQDATTTVQTIALVNVFRNRYAHVPFPYDPVAPLADALEILTESLFSIEPRPHCYNSVLCGGLVLRQTLWRGGLHTRWRGEMREETYFVYPPHKPNVEWPVGPFIYIDPNKRPYVLTRLKDRETGTWEYTRYRAEANSVLSYDAEGILGWMPAPNESEYQQPEDEEVVAAVATGMPPTDALGTTTTSEPPTQTPEGIPDAIELVPRKRMVSTFGEALDAMRRGDHDLAIPFLERLVEERPNYHIGWLRLGYAQREKAARLAPRDKDKSLGLLDASIKSLSNALGHVDPGYRADAFYERSKAYYRRYVVGGQKNDAENAITDGGDARRLSPDTRFQTWMEYFNRIL
jgi:tetratricopeptide (TPR) repeat protein